VRFDPAEWSTVYESSRPSGQAFVFRHGAELALECCLGTAEPGEHWVDIGAGTGHLAARLAAAGLRVTAVDDDATMVRAARTRFGSAGRPDGLGFAVANADALPFQDGTVDGVVATALVGLLGDPRPFLREVSRVLRPGGNAVITFSNRSSMLHGIGIKVRTKGPDRCSRRYAAPARRYTRGEAIAELDRAALEVVRTYYYNFFFAPGRRMWPPRRLALFIEPRLQRPGGALVARNLLAVAAKAPASAGATRRLADSGAG
jgi:ubiquinone/menaquinone biosynthesis C-methylase UbiE